MSAPEKFAEALDAWMNTEDNVGRTTHKRGGSSAYPFACEFPEANLSGDNYLGLCLYVNYDLLCGACLMDLRVTLETTKMGFTFQGKSWSPEDVARGLEAYLPGGALQHLTRVPRLPEAPKIKPPGWDEFIETGRWPDPPGIDDNF